MAYKNHDDWNAWISKHKENTIQYSRNYNRSLRGQFKHMKHSAKNRGLDATLSFADFCLLRVLPCHYCGNSLAKTGTGLDRVHRTIGYVQGNVVPCCHRCNVAKGHLEMIGFPLTRISILLQEIIQESLPVILPHRKPEVKD